jgi:hypothetical protein
LYFLSFYFFVAKLTKVFVISVKTIDLDEGAKGLIDVLLNLQTDRNERLFPLRAVIALRRYDLVGVNSSKQLPYYILAPQQIQLFLQLLEEDRLELINVHLLVYLDERLLLRVFYGLRKGHRIYNILIWVNQFEEQLLHALKYVRILLTAVLLALIGLNPLGIQSQQPHLKLWNHEELLEEAVHVADASRISEPPVHFSPLGVYFYRPFIGDPPKHYLMAIFESLNDALEELRFNITLKYGLNKLEGYLYC